jgi:hypothetical protein
VKRLLLSQIAKFAMTPPHSIAKKQATEATCFSGRFDDSAELIMALPVIIIAKRVLEA